MSGAKVPASARRADPGLAAVARVRSVRERDSRLGLQQALRDLRDREVQLARLEETLRQHGSFVSGDMQQFVTLRQSLAAVRYAITRAREELAAARLMAIDAEAHWQSDHARLGAVEGLLERRADERRAEALREEGKELDEVAGRLWMRGQAS